MDIFWGSSQNCTSLRSQFYAVYGIFLLVKVQNGEYFLGLLKFQMFFRVLGIAYIFGGEQ